MGVLVVGWCDLMQCLSTHAINFIFISLPRDLAVKIIILPFSQLISNGDIKLYSIYFQLIIKGGVKLYSIDSLLIINGGVKLYNIYFQLISNGDIIFYLVDFQLIINGVLKYKLFVPN